MQEENNSENYLDFFKVPPARVDVKRSDLKLVRRDVAFHFGVDEDTLAKKMSACMKWLFGSGDWYSEGSLFMWRNMMLKTRNTVNEQPDPKYAKWLVDTFGVILYANERTTHRHICPDNLITIGSGHWLKDFKKEILAKLSEGWTLVVSNTGSGKTELVKYIVSCGEHAFVIVPNISHLELYRDKCIIVTRDTERIMFEDDKSYAMVWDQFVRRVTPETLERLKDHIVILDESHQTFTDRSYRDMAEKVSEAVKDCKNRVLLLTATETNEREVFGIKNECVMRFYKEREPVGVVWMDTDNPKKLIKKIVALSDSNYDKIAVLSDTCASSLWLEDPGAAFLSAKYSKNDDDYMPKETYSRRTLEKEMLVRKHTYMTKWVCTGINLRNEEKTLLIVESNAQNDYSYIVQAIGRFRNVSPVVIVVNNLRSRESFSEQHDPVSRNVGYRMPDAYVNYINKESRKEVKIRKMCGTGYIDVVDEGFILQLNVDDFSVNPLKRWASDTIRDMVTEGDWHGIDKLVKSAVSNPEQTDPYMRDYTESLTTLRGLVSEETITAFTKVTTYGNNKLMDKVLEEMITLNELVKMNTNAIEWIKNDYEGYVKNIIAYIGYVDRMTCSDLMEKHKMYARLLKMIEPYSNDNDIFNQKGLEQVYAYQVKEKKSKMSGNNNSKKQVTIEYIGNPEDWCEELTITFNSKGDMMNWLIKHGFKRKDVRDFSTNRVSKLDALFRLR